MWEWIYKNLPEFYDRMGANLHKPGAGVLRKIDDKDLDEIRRIFEETGAMELQEAIEKFSVQKAEDLGYDTDADGMDKYFVDIFKGNV